MTTKQLLNLLSPSLIFVIIGITAFALSNKLIHDYQVERYLHEQNQRVQSLRLDKFITEVKNGTRQITTDQWIEAMQLFQAAIQAEKDFQLYQSQNTTLLAKFIRILGWTALAGLGCQISAVFYFKRSNKNQASPSSRRDKCE